MTQSIGAKLTPVLQEIEATLWGFEADVGTPPLFPLEGFIASQKICWAALMDKMYVHQKYLDLSLEEAEKMADQAGKDFRNLIKKYTGLDSHDFYN